MTHWNIHKIQFFVIPNKLIFHNQFLIIFYVIFHGLKSHHNIIYYTIFVINFIFFIQNDANFFHIFLPSIIKNFFSIHIEEEKSNLWCNIIHCWFRTKREFDKKNNEKGFFPLANRKKGKFSFCFPSLLSFRWEKKKIFPMRDSLFNFSLSFVGWFSFGEHFSQLEKYCACLLKENQCREMFFFQCWITFLFRLPKNVTLFMQINGFFLIFLSSYKKKEFFSIGFFAMNVVVLWKRRGRWESVL